MCTTYRIDDFEFTPECAIFDLLDIPIYHGWIVDPQDYETATAIGSKSYNAIMGELVALETQTMEISHKNNSEDCLDFAPVTSKCDWKLDKLEAECEYDITIDIALCMFEMHYVALQEALLGNNVGFNIENIVVEGLK